MILTKLLLILFLCMSTIASQINLTKEEEEYLSKKQYLTTMSLARFHPFGFIKNAEHLGYSNDLLRLFSKILNKDLKYVTKPWKEQLEMLQDGSLDFIPYIVWNKEREKYMDFTNFEYFTFLNGITVRKNSKINSVKDLKDKTIAVVNKYWYHDHLKEHFPNIKLLLTTSTEASIEAVAQGKADVAMDNMTSMNYYIQDGWLNHLTVKKIDELKLPIRSKVYMSVKKGNKILISIIEKAYNTIPQKTILDLKKKWSFVENTAILLNNEEKVFLKNKKKLRVQNLSTFPPFNYTENNKPLGYSVDYMKLIAKQLDIELEFINGKPWGEYLQMIKENKLDIIPHIAVTKERKEFIDFTNFNHIEYVTGLAVKKGDSFKSMEDLNTKVIAVAKKTFLHTHLKNKFPNQSLFLSDSTSMAVQAVSEGKADAVIGSLPSLKYYIQKNWLENVKTITIEGLELPLKTKMPMGVAKGNKILKSILEKANSNIPYNEVVNLKEKWMGKIDTSKIQKSSLLKNEVDYLKNKKKLKICVLPNWLPFEQINEKGEHIGIGNDIMKIVSKYINTPIELVPTKQWSKSLENIKSRKCDILPVSMDIPSRHDSMNFTKPYISEPFVIATKSNKLFIKDEKELSDKKIGIVSGYAFIEVIKTKNPNIEIIEVKNTEEGLEKVRSGELFAYIDTMPTIGYFIQKYRIVDLKIAGKLDYDIKLSIASRNDEPILNTIMQKALDNISQKDIRKIVGRWVEIKVHQEFDYSKLLYIVVFFSIIIFLILYRSRTINLMNKKLNEVNKKLYEEQKVTESLSRSQQSLLSLFDIGDAVLFKWKITEEQKEVEFISESIYGLIGFTPNEFLTKKVIYSEYIHKDDLHRVKKRNKKALKNKSIYFKHEPYRIVTKEGIEKWVIDYRVSEKEGNNISYQLAYISDITEHIKNQEDISHQTKMISLGEMIGNIAHQWRQPLSLISSVATGSILQKEMNILTDEEFYKNMNLINNNTKYLSKTIDDFRNFVKGNRDLINFNLSEKIDTFLNLVHPSIVNNKITIIKEYDLSIELKNYPDDLIQSLINIYNNSKDVLKDLPEEERYFFIQTKILNDKIVISLKDNGKGINKDFIKKVFEPYSTTKHQSQGTGLGMSITYNFIVNGMKGDIIVQNSKFNYNEKEYTGAEFIISLAKTY